MKKINIFMTALLSMGFVACTENFDPAVGPQTNIPESQLQTSDITVSSTAPNEIKLTDYIDAETSIETPIPIGVATVKEGAMPANTILKAEVEVSRDADFAESVIIDANSMEVSDEITIQPSVLQDAYFSEITKNPNTTSLYIRVIMYTLTNGEALASIGNPNENFYAAKTVSFTPLNKITIAPAYYIIGGPNDWEQSAANRSIKFKHSGEDVYVDPIFTVVFDAKADGDTWFAIGDDEACDAIGNGDWSKLYGIVGGESESTEGKIERREILKAENSFCVKNAKKIRVTINMMENTFKVEKLNFTEFIYVPGNAQGWSPATAAALHSPNFDGVYTGYAVLDGGFKFTKERNWDGGEYNWSNFTTVSSALNNGAGTDTNIYCDDAGLYFLKVDVGNGTIEATKITNMNLVGDFNGWNEKDDNQKMTWDANNLCFSITGAGVTANGWKFTANNGWGINLGGDPADLVGDGGNLSVVGTTIKLYPCRTTSDKIFCTVE